MLKMAGKIEEVVGIREKTGVVVTYPTIHTITPTIEMRRQRKAKGRPKRKPRGLQSPSLLHISEMRKRRKSI